MTEEHGDAAPASGGADGGSDALDDHVVDDDSLAARVEAIQTTLSALGMRVDSLVTSTTSFRTSLSDRLDEYAEIVNRAARNQTTELEDYRRTSDRTVAEVRSSTAETTKSLTRVQSLVEELAKGDGVREIQAKVTSELTAISDAQDRMAAFLTEALDRFGDSLVQRLTSQQEALSASVGAVTDLVQQMVGQDLAGTVAAIGQQLSAMSPADVVGDLRPELDRLAGALGQLDEGVSALASRDASAGLREDIAQLRAMVAAQGEVDLAAPIADLKAGLDQLRAADPVAPAVAQLDELRTAVDGLASDHAVREVRGDIAAVAELGERLAQASQQIETRLAELATGERVGAVVDEVRAAVASSIGEVVTEVRSAMASPTNEVDLTPLTDTVARVKGEITTMVERLQDSLADVASGEVVGALWDELRALSASIESQSSDHLAALESMKQAARDDAAEAAEAVQQAAREATRDGIAEAVQRAAEEAARQAAQEVARDVVREPGDQGSDLAEALRVELGRLRGELTAGLVVEPSDGLVESMAELQTMVESLTEAGAATSPALDLSGLEDALQAVRAEVAEVGARLDEGLVLADDQDLVPPTPESSASSDLAAEVLDQLGDVHDQIAALRDAVLAEVDAMRDAVDSAGPAPVAPPAGSTVEMVLDPDLLDVLREEIRAAGGVSDALVESLRDELKALRRRIAVKANERVLDDEQLAMIADAVVERLA